LSASVLVRKGKMMAAAQLRSSSSNSGGETRAAH
jgi:hypothetical protein